MLAALTLVAVVVPPVGGAAGNAPLLAAPVAKQRAAAMRQAFIRWANANGVRDASIAIRFDHRLIESDAFGARGVDDIYNVASLSKAITGLCLSRLVDQGKLRYEDRVGDVLAAYFERAGQPSDPRLSVITITQLLTHRGGVIRMVPRPQSAADFAPGMKSPLEEQARRAISRPLEHQPGSRYQYSNQGYVLLSLVIETVSGKSYEQQCKDSIFTPIGITTARLGERVEEQAKAGGGGWSVSTADYARFVEELSLHSPTYGPVTRAWLKAREQDSPAYALGFEIRTRRDGLKVLHHNGLQTDPEIAVSTQFARWPSGMILALSASPQRPQALGQLMIELDAIATGQRPN